jgi:protein-disulfide isomerase
VVNRVRSTTARPPRVYTIVAVRFVLLLALVGLVTGAAEPVDLSVDPVMVKGPATAPVTIVEFSDYQ